MGARRARRPGRRPPFLATPLGIVVLTVVIDLIGFGIVLPLLPLWALRFDASPLEIGGITAAYALMQVIFSPVWGRVSDRVGRRPVILASLAGSAVAALIVGLAGSLLVLLVARVLQGIAGASYAAAQAYVADITTRAERARGMGLIGAAFGVGFVLGPAIGALFSHFDQRLPFFVAAALAAGNFALAYARLPESRPAVARAARPHAGHLAVLRRSLGRRDLAPLVLLSFVGTFAFVGMESTFALLGEARFGYGPVEIGLLFTYIGVATALAQVRVVAPLSARLGETRALMAGLVGTALGLLGLAAAQSVWLLIPSLGLLAIASGVTFSLVTALISLAASDDEQGGVLGVTAATGGVARIGAPLVGTALFQHAGTGAPLILGALLFAGCAAAAMRGAGRPAIVS
jgi:MFS transporter, DHA1 family, tetracycline resistance protein